MYFLINNLDVNEALLSAVESENILHRSSIAEIDVGLKH